MQRSIDGFVNRLQDFRFPSFLLSKLRGLDSYPGGTFTHCSCQPSLDAHFSVLIRLAPIWITSSLPNTLKQFEQRMIRNLLEAIRKVRANSYGGARAHRQEGALQFPSAYAAKLEPREPARFALLPSESSDGRGGLAGLL